MEVLPNTPPLFIDGNSLQLINLILSQSNLNGDVTSDNILELSQLNKRQLKDITGPQRLVLVFFKALNQVTNEEEALEAWQVLQSITEGIFALSTASLVDIGIAFAASLHDKLYPQQEKHVEFLLGNWEAFHNIPDVVTRDYLKSFPVPGPRIATDIDIEKFLRKRYRDEEALGDPLEMQKIKNRLSLVAKIISIPPEGIPGTIQEYSSLKLSEKDIVDKIYALGLILTYYYEPLLKTLSGAEFKTFGKSRDALFVAQSLLTLKLANQALVDSRGKVSDLLSSLFNFQGKIPATLDEFYSNIYFGDKVTRSVGVNYAIAQNNYIRGIAKSRMHEVYGEVSPHLANIAYQIFEIIASLRHTNKFPIYGGGNRNLQLPNEQDRVTNILTSLIASASTAIINQAEKSKKFLEQTLEQLDALAHILTLPNHPGIIALSIRNRLSLTEKIAELSHHLKQGIDVVDQSDDFGEPEEPEEVSEDEAIRNAPEKFKRYFDIPVLTPDNFVEVLTQNGAIPLNRSQVMVNPRKVQAIGEGDFEPIFSLDGRELVSLSPESIESSFQKSLEVLAKLSSHIENHGIRQIKVGFALGGNVIIPDDFMDGYPITPGSIKGISPQHLTKFLGRKLMDNRRLWEHIQNLAKKTINPADIVGYYFDAKLDKLTRPDVEDADFHPFKVEGPFLIPYILNLPYDFTSGNQITVLYRPLVVTTQGYLVRALQSKADIREIYPYTASDTHEYFAFDRQLSNIENLFKGTWYHRMSIFMPSNYLGTSRTFANNFHQKLVPDIVLRLLMNDNPSAPLGHLKMANERETSYIFERFESES